MSPAPVKRLGDILFQMPESPGSGAPLHTIGPGWNRQMRLSSGWQDQMVQRTCKSGDPCMREGGPGWQRAPDETGVHLAGTAGQSPRR